MRILIATGIYPPDIGGPAKYAKNLTSEFLSRGHAVKVLSYHFEKKLPVGIRHLFYFFKILFNFWGTDLIIAFDIFSTGFPSVLAGKIFGKKTILRVGGDFLWETYVEATGNLIKLKDFYKKQPPFSLKFKIIAFAQRFALKNASALVFNTVWQSIIFEKKYHIKKEKIFIVENFYGEKISSQYAIDKNYVFAGRLIKIKNIAVLKDAFEEAKKENGQIKLEIISSMSHIELLEKIKRCYAIILPSVSEINPNVIADAITLGKPFILTKESGFNENIKKLGILVDPFDKTDIKNKILYLADCENYEKYKKNIVDFNFIHSWDEIAEEFLEIYSNI